MKTGHMKKTKQTNKQEPSHRFMDYLEGLSSCINAGEHREDVVG